MKSFKDFYNIRETDSSSDPGTQNKEAGSKDWRKGFIQLEKGFIPPPALRPVIEAFLKSNEVPLMKDTSKEEIKLDKKSLFLVGGPVRDFIRGKAIKDYDLASNATPEQIATILSHAGFKMTPERTGQQGEPLHLPFKPEEAKPGDTKTWFIKGRDASENKKPFVISAVVSGEEFEIATFRKDAKVTDGAAAVDFVDNPHDDASRRDLTINSLYIELTKSNGENGKLYDPTGKGWHDVKHGEVRTVGKAEDRFQEDKLRVMRAIRFHSRFSGSAKMDPEIEKALPRFKNLQGVAQERIRDEFLKGLLHPDVDPRVYLSIYARTGLIDKVFPGIQINLDIPTQFRDKRDKPLALAWILQNNSFDKVSAALAATRNVNGEDKPSGWSVEEMKAVLYLLALKEFDPEHVDDFMTKKEGTGLSDEQIKDWVDMFKMADTTGRVRDRRPQWATQVRTFTDFKPNWKDMVDWTEKKECPGCQGKGCTECGGKGYVKGGMHPEIIAGGYQNVPPHMRGQIVKGINKTKLSTMFKDKLPKNE